MSRADRAINNVNNGKVLEDLFINLGKNSEGRGISPRGALRTQLDNLRPLPCKSAYVRGLDQDKAAGLGSVAEI